VVLSGSLPLFLFVIINYEKERKRMEMKKNEFNLKSHFLLHHPLPLSFPAANAREGEEN